ncbi:hypothetical protein HN873_019396 [Arachis hypogaea]
MLLIYLLQKRFLQNVHELLLLESPNRLTSFLLSCYNPLAAELPFSSVHRTETKYRTGANSSSRKKELTEPKSLTNTNLILN